MEVISVNHGNVFNTGNWFTFHCPACKAQITRSDSGPECEHCNQALIWKEKEPDYPMNPDNTISFERSEDV